MSESGIEFQKQYIINLIEKHDSMRGFARVISEDPADVLKWRDGKIAIHPRAAITLVRIFGANPHDLRPDIFPANTKITFVK